MKKSTLYLALLILGAALPLAFFIPFVAERGLDVMAFFSQVFVNRISGFFAVDVLVSGLATIVFTLHESRRLGLEQGILASAGARRWSLVSAAPFLSSGSGSGISRLKRDKPNLSVANGPIVVHGL